MIGRLTLHLATRLLLAFAALTVPLLLFSVWSFQRSLAERRETALDGTVDSARTAAALVTGLLRNLDSTSALLSLSFGQQTRPLDQATTGEALTAIAARYPMVRAVFLTDPRGRVVAAQRGEGIGVDLGGRPYTQALLGGAEFVVTDATAGIQTGEPTVVMARAVRAPDGSLRGLLVIAFYPGNLAELFPQAPPPDADLTVLDRRGQVIYSSARPNLPTGERDLSGSAAVRAALAGEVVTTTGSRGLDGRERLGALVPVPEYGWAVGYTRTTAAVVGPLESLYRRQVFGLALVMLLALTAALLLSRRLTGRLTRLAVHARAFGRGETTRPAPMDGPIEVQELAAALNAMAQEIEARFAERAAAEAALREAEARYRGIFEHALEGIFQTGFDARFRAVNPAGARILGYDSPEEMMRAVPDVRALYADPSRLQAYIELIQREGAVSNFEFEVRRKDGSLCWLSMNARALRDADGSIAGVEGMVTDISERKQVEREREHLLAREQAARAEAEAAVALRDQFLSMAAHELRTPLTPLRASLQLMRRQIGRGTTVEELEPLAARAEKQQERLTRLIATMLDVSRIAGGTFALEREPLDLGALARRIVEDATATWTPPREVVLTMPPEPALVSADELRLEQVAINLLENAAKYSDPETPIAVQVTGTEDTVCLTVEDQGIGIPSEEQAHIFERFQRASNVDRGIAGFGLGLYIARWISELHGGRLSVESSPGTGSTFTLTLPRLSPSPEDRPPEAAEPT